VPAVIRGTVRNEKGKEKNPVPPRISTHCVVSGGWWVAELVESLGLVAATATLITSR
jgi:hypothetical protein